MMLVSVMDIAMMLFISWTEVWVVMVRTFMMRSFVVCCDFMLLFHQFMNHVIGMVTVMLLCHDQTCICSNNSAKSLTFMF